MGLNDMENKAINIKEKMKDPNFVIELKKLLNEINENPEISQTVHEIFVAEDEEKRKDILEKNPDIREKLNRINTMIGRDLI